jgi:group II intron reverse transcriptase/maturase
MGGIAEDRVAVVDDVELWPRVVNREALFRAWNRVRAKRGAAGIDGQSVADFERVLTDEIDRLARELATGQYRPRALKRFRLPKIDGRWRTIGIPALRDRVVQHALLAVIGPIFERTFHPSSYAYRRGRSVQQAARKVMDLIGEGYAFILRTDIGDCFDSLDHGVLLAALRRRIDDDDVIRLIEQFLGLGAVEGMILTTPTSGAAQGSVLSPLFANVYLDPFDYAMAKRGWKHIRYADDIAIFSRGGQELESARLDAEELLRGLKLRINREKTATYGVEEGVPFLGFLFSADGRAPDLGAVSVLHRRLADIRDSSAHRSSGEALAEEEMVIRGWTSYYGIGAAPFLRDGRAYALLVRIAGEREGCAAVRELLRHKARPAFSDQPSFLHMCDYLRTLDMMDEAELRTVDHEARRVRESAREVDADSAREGNFETTHDGGDDELAALRAAFERDPTSPETRADLVDALARRGQGALAARVAAGRAAGDGFPVASGDGGDRGARAADPGKGGVHGGGRSGTSQGGSVACAPQSETIDLPGESLIPQPGDGAEKLMLRWFEGREGIYAREQIGVDGRRRFSTVDAPLDPDLLAAHLRGEETLAVYPLRVNDTVKWGALDIDVSGRIALAHPADRAQFERALQATHLYMLEVAAVMRAEGGDPLLVDSGRRGRHIWVRCEKPVGARVMRDWLRSMLDRAPKPAGPITVEIVPDRIRLKRGGHGACLKLPWARHGLTLRRSLLLDAEGEVGENQVELLRKWGATPARILDGCAEAEEDTRPAVPDHAVLDPPPVDDIPRQTPLAICLQGCPILRYLIHKATHIGFLSHSERLVLLTTLGHTGSDGHRLVHRTMAKTVNYDARITQKQIERMPGKPMGCARIRERLPDVTAALRCDCRFHLPARGYPSPVLHAAGLGVDRDERANGGMERQRQQRFRSEKADADVVASVPKDETPTVSPADLRTREVEERLRAIEGALEEMRRMLAATRGIPPRQARDWSVEE